MVVNESYARVGGQIGRMPREGALLPPDVAMGRKTRLSMKGDRSGRSALVRVSPLLAMLGIWALAAVAQASEES
jgi:hypothetical protein